MITIYTKPDCKYCDQTKEYLNYLNIPYVTIDITDNEDAAKFLLSENHKTVPQIYNNDKLFVEGGYSGLMLVDVEVLKNPQPD